MGPQKMMIEFTYENDDGDEDVHELPSKFEVCSRCEGHGTHLHPDIGSHGYSSQEFAEEFDDEEREQYFMHGGRYDVTCESCGGNRVVSVVDEETCEKDPKLAELLKRWQENVRAEADYARECEFERRLGC